jgi:hypothetical protein
MSIVTSEGTRFARIPRRSIQAAATGGTLLLTCGIFSLVVWRAAPNLNGPKGILADRPGIQQPPAFSPTAVQLPDDAELIGITASGQCRAYLIDALWHPGQHVVNDLLGATPISVTWCPRTGCIRAFTDASSGRPLDIAEGGWTERYEDRSFLLLVGSTRYRQDNGQPVLEATSVAFPYSPVEFQRTTWKQWRGMHPDTDVYVGQ